MPCKQLNVDEYNALLAADPTASGYTQQDCPGNCCLPPIPGSERPTDCCLCTNIYGWTQYRDSDNLNYRGLPGNVVENPLGFCPADYEEYGPGPRLIEDGQFAGKYAYDVLCKNEVFIDCSYWLQPCGEILNFPPSEGFGGGSVQGFCYLTGTCVNGKCVR